MSWNKFCQKQGGPGTRWPFVSEHLRSFRHCCWGHIFLSDWEEKHSLVPVASISLPKDLCLENPFLSAGSLTLCSVGWCWLNIIPRGFLIWWRRELILTALCHIEFAACFYCNLHLKINQEQSQRLVFSRAKCPGRRIHVLHLLPTNCDLISPSVKWTVWVRLGSAGWPCAWVLTLALPRVTWTVFYFLIEFKGL